MKIKITKKEAKNWRRNKLKEANRKAEEFLWSLSKKDIEDFFNHGSTVSLDFGGDIEGIENFLGVQEAGNEKEFRNPLARAYQHLLRGKNNSNPDYETTSR